MNFIRKLIVVCCCGLFAAAAAWFAAAVALFAAALFVAAALLLRRCIRRDNLQKTVVSAGAFDKNSAGYSSHNPGLIVNHE